MTGLDKFRQVYADAVIPNMSDSEWETASKIRELQWEGKRVTLATAAKFYASILEGYNQFKANMIEDLHNEFSDSGIEVTPARMYSVGILLHIPKDFRGKVKTFVETNFDADELFWKSDDTLRVWWD